MPRGFILLVLLLLIGGYFLFFHSSSGNTYVIPSISAEGKVVESSMGFNVILDGKLSLPGEGDYKVETFTATLMVDGIAADKKDFGSHEIKGPDEFPFTFAAPFTPSVSKVSIRIDANVSYGKDVYVLSAVIPVALPDKTTLVKKPSVAVSLSSVSLLGPTKSATVYIDVFNPNDQAITLKNVTLSFGNEEFDLATSQKVNGKDHALFEQVLSVPADVTSITITFSTDYSASGVERSLQEEFELNLPKLEEQPLRVGVSLSAASVSESGYEANISGKVYNDNKFNVGIDALILRVVSNRSDSNIIQEVSLLEDADIAPESSVSFSKRFTVDDDFSSAVAEVVLKRDGKETVMYSFPLGLFDPTDFFSAPDVRIAYIYDANTGCSFYPVVKNTNDFNVDFDITISVTNGSTNVSKDYDTFTLGANGTKSFETDPVGPLPGELNVTVSGKYGVENMGIWIPFSVVAEYNCAT